MKSAQFLSFFCLVAEKCKQTGWETDKRKTRLKNAVHLDPSSVPAVGCDTHNRTSDSRSYFQTEILLLAEIPGQAEEHDKTQELYFPLMQLSAPLSQLFVPDRKKRLCFDKRFFLFIQQQFANTLLVLLWDWSTGNWLPLSGSKRLIASLRSERTVSGLYKATGRLSYDKTLPETGVWRALFSVRGCLSESTLSGQTDGGMKCKFWGGATVTKMLTWKSSYRSSFFQTKIGWKKWVRSGCLIYCSRRKHIEPSGSQHRGARMIRFYQKKKGKTIYTTMGIKHAWQTADWAGFYTWLQLFQHYTTYSKPLPPWTKSILYQSHKYVIQENLNKWLHVQWWLSSTSPKKLKAQIFLPL